MQRACTFIYQLHTFIENAIYAVSNGENLELNEVTYNWTEMESEFPDYDHLASRYATIGPHLSSVCEQ